MNATECTINCPGCPECDGPEHCHGCDEPREDLAAFRVTFHNGIVETCVYCPECAGLASIDWNGETAAIEPLV